MEVDLTVIDTDEQSDDSLPPSGLVCRNGTPVKFQFTYDAMQTNTSSAVHNLVVKNTSSQNEVHCLSSSDESERSTKAVADKLLSNNSRASTTSAYSESDGDSEMLPSLKERMLLLQEPVSATATKPVERVQPVLAHEISSDDENELIVQSVTHHGHGTSSSDVVDLIDTNCKESVTSKIQHTPKKKRKRAKSADPVKAAELQKQKEERAAEREVKRQKRNLEAQAKKERAAASQAAKLQKRVEKEKEKLLKEVVTEARRKEKPGECIKLMKVLIDCHLLELPEGALLLPLLQSLNIRYQVQSLAAPYAVMWQREVSISSMDDEDKIVVKTQDVDEDEVIIQIPLQLFVGLVDALKQEQAGVWNSNESLLSYIRKIKELFVGKRISYIVQGLSQYLRDHKNANQRKVRSAVLGANQNQKRKTKARTPSIETCITEMDVEECLVIAQIQECCHISLVETSADVANMVSSFTKAIAEAPYKREKYNNGFSWFAALDSRKCVRVPDSGEGLLRLWQQHIDQFNMVGSEAAQAVVAQYPSPTALLQAYDRCASQQECEALLQDIQVRRGAGPLARTRKVGPELSRKVYLFFTSSNPNLNLNAT